MRRAALTIIASLVLTITVSACEAPPAGETVPPSTVRTSSTSVTRAIDFYDESDLEHSACVRSIVEYGEYIGDFCLAWDAQEDDERLAPFFAEFYGGYAP